MPELGVTQQASQPYELAGRDTGGAVTAAETTPIGKFTNLLDSTAGIMTITLPPIAEAQGHTYSYALLVDGGDVTIQHNNADSVGWSNAVLTAVGDHISYKSDGRNWLIVDSLLT